MAYLVYMVLGMSSLRGVNLAMYTTLRRTTSAFTMVAECAPPFFPEANSFEAHCGTRHKPTEELTLPPYFLPSLPL